MFRSFFAFHLLFNLEQDLLPCLLNGLWLVADEVMNDEWIRVTGIIIIIIIILIIIIIYYYLPELAAHHLFDQARQLAHLFPMVLRAPTWLEKVDCACIDRGQ